MKLYHTGDREIKRPDIHHGRKNADFGWGFYLTPDREFTYRWAGENAFVNEYELDEEGLDIRRFSRDADWFQYIYHNRRLQDSISADVIIGPIANDTIFDTLGIISSGFLKPEDAVKLLMVGPEYTQAAIKTEKAAAKLKWIRTERIERLSGNALKAERDAFQEEFAAELERIMEG
jgi:hypothetical protein